MGRYKQSGPNEFFEAKIEHTSMKARLVEMTLGGKYWVPMSQTVSLEGPDLEGNFMFEVSEWWWNKKSEVEDE